ncbi:MAG: hypothetical protein ACP5XB_22690 [Isosphaeraceae bacterium]
MSEARRSPHWSGEITTYTYDPEARLVSVEAPTPPGSSWEHDEAKRVFRVTEPDGKVIEFHDRAQSFLVVAPDPQTEKLAPVLLWGMPRVMYLCREAGL